MPLGVVLDILDVYDPSANTWTRLRRMPIRLATECVVAYYGGKIYAAGGRQGMTPGVNPVKKLLIYDIATDTWSLGAPMPEPRALAAVGTCGIKILAIGGWNGTSMMNTVFVYNPFFNTWDYGPPMPTAKAQAQGVTVRHPDGTVAIHVAGGGIGGSSAGDSHYAFLCPAVGGNVKYVEEHTSMSRELLLVILLATSVLATVVIASKLRR